MENLIQNLKISACFLKRPRVFLIETSSVSDTELKSKINSYPTRREQTGVKVVFRGIHIQDTFLQGKELSRRGELSASGLKISIVPMRILTFGGLSGRLTVHT